MNEKASKAVITGALALVMSLSFANAAQANGPEFNARFDIENPLGGPDTRITIPVDCDLLDSNGDKTIEFVRQFGVWGHIENETSIVKAETHLRLHGLDPNDINRAAQLCLDNF